MNFMLQTRRRRFALYLLTIVAGMLVSCLVLAAIGFYSNQNLSKSQEITDRLTELDKVRLTEALHLKTELGNEIWPGYADLEAPVIIWNEDYEFLIGSNMPPQGWEDVPGDNFDGMVYFRRPSKNPQNFAVALGDQWAASIFTKNNLDDSLITKISDLLPPVISEVFPYRIFIQPSEMQISGVQHEYFHVIQALSTPEKFAASEAVYKFDDQYWMLDEDRQPSWKVEVNLLIEALEATSDDEAAVYARQFLAQRAERRRESDQTTDLINYEISLEWLEGIAKYVELRSWELAGQKQGYAPVLEMSLDADFNDYEDFQEQWSQALRQTRRQAGEIGDVRFYYTGMLQAFLLDRLMPDWKERIMEEGVYLEDLLQEVLTL